MKTISTKTNPAFKRVQLLPLLPSVPSAPAELAGMGISAFTPSNGDLRRTITNFAVCALSVSQGLNAPTVRLIS